MKNILVIVIAIFCLVSCSTRKKAMKYFNENNKELAELCKQRFPISETYIKGDTVRVIDTLKITDKETVFVDCPDGTKKECPPKETKYITRVETIIDTIVKIDSRDVAILQEEKKELQQKLDTSEKWKTRFGIACLLFLFGIVIILVFRR